MHEPESPAYFNHFSDCTPIILKAIMLVGGGGGVTVVDVDILMVRSLTCSDFIDTRDIPLY